MKIFVDGHQLYPWQLERAARKVGLIDQGEFEIVIRALNRSRVSHVVVVRAAFRDYPPEASSSMPRAVRDAIEALTTVEEFMRTHRIPIMEPDELRAAVAEHEGVSR